MLQQLEANLDVKIHLRASENAKRQIRKFKRTKNINVTQRPDLGSVEKFRPPVNFLGQRTSPPRVYI